MERKKQNARFCNDIQLCTLVLSFFHLDPIFILALFWFYSGMILTDAPM